MKKILLAIAILGIMLSVSCKKFDDLKPVTFEVYLDSTTFKAGDPVTFKFKGGDANQISYYSGEVGNDYDYRDKNRVDDIKKLFFSFQTHNTPVGNPVVSDILVSTDFDGVYEYPNVAAATWTPMSSEFIWGLNGPWQTMWTASGNKDIAGYFDRTKPFYIAYRVKSPAQPTGTISRNWRTNTHSLIAETLSGNYVSLANFAGMSWKVVDKYLATADIATQSTSTVSSSIMLLGYYNSTNARYRQEAEVWGVSRKFVADKVNLAPEKAVSLKSYVDPPLETFTHYYGYPGKYKVVFLASNATISSSTQVIKELEITVTP